MIQEEPSLRSFDHHSRKHDNYFELYDRHFKPIRERALNILEIGVQYGGSLALWVKYFPKSHITGVDIDPVCKMHVGKRVSIKIGDQTDRAFLGQFKNYDIIIDDGGHTMSQQQISFDVLFPLLNPGGMYVIEDLHTSYWPEFLDSTPTTMEYLAGLTHTLNSAASKSERAASGGAIESAGIDEMHFYPSMCFIHKQRGERSFVDQSRNAGDIRFKIHEFTNRVRRRLFGTKSFSKTVPRI